jgi:non-specific serine/threonine protein kinase
MSSQPPEFHEGADLPAAGTWRPDGVLFGNYRVLRELGRGGMGIVYLAHDPRLDRQVAIKTLSKEMSEPAELERFSREARTLARLSHPNVATVFDLGEHEGRNFLVMEYVEGETLQAVLQRGPLPIEEALVVAVQVAEGLAAAHGQGVVHRDLKPGNVIRTREGRVKILDFGLAKAIAGGAAGGTATQLTLEQHVVGTPGYMSPEQLRGRTVDARSDIFAFGVLLYEMLCGTRPFGGGTLAEVASGTLTASPTPMRERARDIPPELETLVGRCLEKEPDRRCGSMSALLDGLRAVRPGEREAPGPSVAVLPFANLSADIENEYFADGMAEEIINALCKIDQLRVVARTSSFTFKGRNEDVRKIGADLGVGTVLEGSVRRAGKRLRIAAQLVKVSDGYHLWSERFDRDLEDVFAVQDEIAENIAAALRVVLGERERTAIRKMRTTNPEAHDYYLRGLAYLRTISDEGLSRAPDMFQRAVTIDPNYALAWAGLTEALAWIYDWKEHTLEVLQRLDAASRRAIEADPGLPEAHVARGHAIAHMGGGDNARRAFEEAIRLDPRCYEAYWFCGRSYMNEGHLGPAIPYFLKAAAVRPEDFQALILAGNCHRGLGQVEEERDLARRTLPVIDRHLALHANDERAVYFKATCYSSLGEQAKAIEWAELALRMREDSSTRYNVACLFANEGLRERALELLERNVDAGWGNRSWVEHDPDMNPLRDHPRFQALLERMPKTEA